MTLAGTDKADNFPRKRFKSPCGSAGLIMALGMLKVLDAVTRAE